MVFYLSGFIVMAITQIIHFKKELFLGKKMFYSFLAAFWVSYSFTDE
jgi:hypothetical protein